MDPLPGEGLKGWSRSRLKHASAVLPPKARVAHRITAVTVAPCTWGNLLPRAGRGGWGGPSLPVTLSCIRWRGIADQTPLMQHPAPQSWEKTGVQYSPTSKQMDKAKPVFSNKLVYYRKVQTHESEGDGGDPRFSHCQILDPDQVWILSSSDVLRRLVPGSVFLSHPSTIICIRGRKKPSTTFTWKLLNFKDLF